MLKIDDLRNRNKHVEKGKKIQYSPKPLQEAGVAPKMQFPFKLLQAFSISEVIYLKICVSYFEALMIISFDGIFFSSLFCTEDFKVRETVWR